MAHYWWTLTQWLSWEASPLSDLGAGVAWGRGMGKDLEKTAGVAPGTGRGDNVAMDVIRRQEQYRPLRRAQHCSPGRGWSSNASHVDL